MMIPKRKYLVSDCDRYGNVRVYVRRWGRKIRLKPEPGSPDFEIEYEAAVAALAPLRKPEAPISLYVVAVEGRDSPVKIGITGKLKARLQSLQVGHPERLMMTPVLELSKGTAHRFERAIHAHFSEAKMTGEWFSITSLQAVSYILRVRPPTSRSVSHILEVTSGGAQSGC